VRAITWQVRGIGVGTLDPHACDRGNHPLLLTRVFLDPRLNEQATGSAPFIEAKE
jgi:hypothetical protein